MEAELAALASSGATALVGLMVSESWDRAKLRLARFFAQHGRPGPEGATDEDLQSARDELRSARQADDTGAAADIEAEWRQRLRRALREDPAAARELRSLLTELAHEAGVEWDASPHAEISGGVQNGPVFQNTQIHGGIVFQAQPPAPLDAKPDQVPARTSRFVNRTEELLALDGFFTALADGSPHIDIGALDGLPGVGKTAMACRWAEKSRNLFPDGQIYVDFAELRGTGGGADVFEAVGMCLRALGVADAYLPQSLTERTQLFRSHSAGRRILLVLDDVDQPAQVRALVPKGPGSAVLVTSSSRLGELAAVEGARLMSLEPLDAAGGLKLLAARCGQQAVDDEPAAAEQLVGLCAGLPVALQVAAARLMSTRRLTMAALAAELADETGRLAALSLRGEHSVSAVFGTSYAQLPPDAARLYRLLGWVPGRTFDTGTAAVAAGLPPATAQDLLDVLDDASLLEATPDGRYRMHGLVRLHARECAADEESPAARRQLIGRVTTHYLALTAFADRAVRADRLRIAELSEVIGGAPDPFASPSAPRPLAWLEAERPNILAVLREAAQQGLHTPVWQLSEAFTVLFLHRRHLRDWMESLELGAASAAAAMAPAAEGRLRSLLSRPLMDLGEYDRARTELDSAVACAEIADHTALRASVQELLGRYLDHADPSRAAAAYQRSLELNESAGERRGAAIAAYFLGRAQDRDGDSAAALTTLRHAHAGLTACSDLRMAARVTAATGEVHDHLGDTEEAVRALREAAVALRAQEATHYEAQALVLLAGIAQRPGNDRSTARADLTRALEIYEAGGSPLADALRERLRDPEDLS
ncbi:ATP-binding protein [Streptomyces sp. NBC_00455]|uniref:ATP-binding protein n=1 Tax=Streptomyces sp. NBC_00455 TaxID=2903654 RepID=UPI002E21C80E